MRSSTSIYVISTTLSTLVIGVCWALGAEQLLWKLAVFCYGTDLLMLAFRRYREGAA